MLFATLSLYSQDGAYTNFTPYSIFAVGELSSPGSAYNAGMGGVGIATRNKRYVNILTPASVTARDSLSFMSSMSLHSTNKAFSQSDMTYVNNTFNVNEVVISFPIYRSSAVMLGMAPYSGTGYSYAASTDDPKIIESTQGMNYSSAGKGGVHQLFAAGGVTFWKRLSLGAEYIAYFGRIERASNLTFVGSGYSSVRNGSNLTLRGSAAKFGMQYEQPLGGGMTLGIGGTYKMKAGMRGYAEDYKLAVGSAQSDTLRYRMDTLKLNRGLSYAPEIGVGISLNANDRWRAEVDYIRSDWTKSGVATTTGFAVSGKTVFGTTVAEALRAGFEITPNRNDIRYYYRRCTYRAGAYWNKSYYTLDNHPVHAIGITLGGTLPVLNNYNGLTFAIDIGQRGTKVDGMIRERYVNFTIGLNYLDYWFRKPHYE